MVGDFLVVEILDQSFHGWCLLLSHAESFPRLTPKLSWVSSSLCKFLYQTLETKARNQKGGDEFSNFPLKGSFGFDLIEGEEKCSLSI